VTAEVSARTAAADHDLRHIGLAGLADAGILREIVGHRLITTAQRYFHLDASPAPRSWPNSHPSSGDLRVGAFLDEWLEAKRPSLVPNAWAGYRACLDAAGRFGGEPVFLIAFDPWQP
jgi:hypothetical protein